MSAIAPARVRPARPAQPAAPSAPRRTPLRVVPSTPAVAGRIPFAVLVALTLTAGLVGLLMLHTLAAQDAFTLRDLQHRTAALADTEQELALADQQAQAPSTLAARARALGMVPTGPMHLVRRADGRLVAVASAEPAPPRPAPKTTAAASPKTTASPKPTAGAATGKPKPTAAKHHPATTTARHTTTRHH